MLFDQLQVEGSRKIGVCEEVMSNIIRLNEKAPDDEWIVMSNQGTDCFLDLLITAAVDFEKTEQQKNLISFLKNQKISTLSLREQLALIWMKCPGMPGL